MKILSHSGGIAQTNCYVIADEASAQAVLFDAPDHTVLPLLQEIKGRKWNLLGLWLTHGHFDHLADHAIVKQHFPTAQILIHPLDEPKLLDPKPRFFELPFTIPPGKPDGYLQDGQELTIGSLALKVIHTPGHAPGHVMFHFPAEKLLVGGDLIICNAVGRTDLPDSNPADLTRSIQKIMKLSPDTKLLPGHCAASTLGEELAANPHVIEAMS
jgi:hydroxyacylglutathione hydrolase